MGGTTFWVTVAAVVSGLAGAAVAFDRARRVALDGTAVLRGFLATAAVGLLSFVVLRLWFLQFFGGIHLAYLGVTLSLPILGLGVLASARGRAHGPGVIVVAVLLLVPAPLGIYGTHVGPNQLVTEREVVTVDAARAGDDPLRIAVLADLQTNHIGDHERRAVDAVMAARPDVILVPGDLFQAETPTFVRWLPELRALLSGLRARYGVYVVSGDVDSTDRVALAFRDTDAEVIDDRVVTVRAGDRLLRIGGTALDYESPAARSVKRRLEGGPDDGSIRILLSHRPDTVFGLQPDSRVDLTVAGHTHGGQVVIPGIGPVITMSSVPRAVARGGLHDLDGNRMYVSRGVGVERLQAPQVRINCPPTIGVLDLRDARTASGG